MERRALVLHHPLCLGHVPPEGHPESPERQKQALAALSPVPAGVIVREAQNRPVASSLLESVHTRQWIDTLLSLRGHVAQVETETFVSAGSVDAALAAVAIVVEIVDEVMAGRASSGLALLRPPGHHAEPDKPMGYCLLNNIAIAATHALSTGLSRILILDWDVHHGNGTQHIFEDRSDVMFVDLHQEELFPPGGGVEETGKGPGQGYTMNIPLPSGCTDGEYVWILERVLPALCAWYKPELLLVSCGFDASAGDSEGGMEVSPRGFAELTAIAKRLAEQYCKGRLVMVLEGGYSLPAVAASTRAVVEVLGGACPLPLETYASPSVRAALENANAHRRALGFPCCD